MTRSKHIDDVIVALRRLDDECERLDEWGRQIASVLGRGGRILTAGNGGSAAHAQHLTAELVGRYQDERRALSAIALHADTSAFTAIVNDYGPEHGFARSVQGHGRPGDVLAVFSTSGRSPNILHAVGAARDIGMVVYAFTGPTPNPVACAVEHTLSVSGSTPTVQEVHQVAIHLLCSAIDAALLGQTDGTPTRTTDHRASRPVRMNGAMS
jgi:D-sedoheptulose 7-phosphate isomerase